MAQVLIIDNNTAHSEMVARTLNEHGSVSRREHNGVRGVESALTNPPDLVVVELDLPDISGIEVIRRLKREVRTSEIPIFCISENDTEMEKIVAFELGATDYQVKPINKRELALRVQAILRRTTAQDDRSLLNVGPIRIDTGLFKTTAYGKDISLTQREFRILLALAQTKGRVLSREELLDTAWGDDAEVQDRTVDAHIRAIRAKLGPAATCLETVNRVGYCLRAQSNPVALQNDREQYEQKGKPVSLCSKKTMKTQNSSRLKNNQAQEEEKCLRKIYG